MKQHSIVRKKKKKNNTFRQKAHINLMRFFYCCFIVSKIYDSFFWGHINECPWNTS